MNASGHLVGMCNINRITNHYIVYITTLISRCIWRVYYTLIHDDRKYMNTKWDNSIPGLFDSGHNTISMREGWQREYAMSIS